MGSFANIKRRIGKKALNKAKDLYNKRHTPIGVIAKQLGVELPEALKGASKFKVRDIYFTHIDVEPDSAVILPMADETLMVKALNKFSKIKPKVIFLDKDTYDNLDKSGTEWDKLPLVFLEDAKTQCHGILEKYRKGYKGKVVGITGSFGKTTTKMFIGGVLKDKAPIRYFANKANNNSLHSIMNNIMKHMGVLTKYFVQEVGAVRIDAIKVGASYLRPDFAVVTNVKPHHLGSYGTFEALFKDKLELVENLNEGGTAIVNFDDEGLRNYDYKCNLVSFGIECEEKVDFRGKNLRSVSEDGVEHLEMDVEYVPFIKGAKVNGKPRTCHVITQISGEYNAYNVLAAFALGMLCKVKESEILESISKIKMQGNRQNLMKYGKNTLFVDCYNVANETIINSANILAQIETEEEGKKIAIVGAENGLGKDRKAKTQELAVELAKLDLDQIICFGRASKEDKALERYGDVRTLYRTLKKEGVENVRMILSKKKLYEYLRDEVRPEDVILFKCITYLGVTIPMDRAFGTNFSLDTNLVKKKKEIIGENGFLGYSINTMEESLITEPEDQLFKAKEITIPDNFLGLPVFGIDKKAFSESNVEKLDLGENVKVILPNAFKGCKRLKEISFSNNLMHIMEGSFKDCTALREIRLGDKIRQIDGGAFENCNGLKEVYISKDAQIRIEENAFPETTKINWV